MSQPTRDRPKREFYDYQDIVAITGLGKSKVYDILHELEAQGKAFKHGKRLMVRIPVFYAYLAEKDGYIPPQYKPPKGSSSKILHII